MGMEKEARRRNIFERLGRRIGSAGQGLVRRTKNASEEKRLNRLISQNREEMNELFWKLGQSYYMKHRQETDCCEQDFVDKLNVLLEQNVQCREEIRRLHQVTVCEKCGARLKEDALFCSSCGAGLEAEEPCQEGKICPDCGEKLPQENIFCNYCGKKLE